MSEQGSSMRKSVSRGVVAFGVALAVIIGVRMDQAALTVIVGVACGVIASVPTGLMVVYLLRRRDTANDKRLPRGYGREFGHSPPVVVISPPAAPQLPQPAAWSGAYAPNVPAQRQFAVIGEEGVDDEFDYW
jgi:hypothetical protein